MKIYKVMNLLIFILFLGCTPEVAEWTPAESPKKNKVERTVFMYTISYPAHADGMETREKKKLQQFLKNTIPTPSAVTVTLFEYGGYSEKRIKDIKRELVRHGIPDDLILIDYEKAEGGCKTHKRESNSGVEIMIEKYVVIPPSCSNFSQNIGDAKQSTSTSNYGCATEAGFGMMVANPRDLIQGLPRDAYDGTVLVAGIKRYHDGKITPLIDTSTTTTPTAQNPTAQQSGSTTSAGASTGIQ